MMRSRWHLLLNMNRLTHRSVPGVDSFWCHLPRPFFALAPMADVTDVAFRTMFARHGRPDVFWTEFVSADGLCSPGREVLRADLLYMEDQRPIVAQLFTATPAHMYEAGCLVRDLGFDGLDINMGCPDRTIMKQGSGAALISTPSVAADLIAAAKRSGLPVSVKTRIGDSREEIDSWIPTLLQCDIAALTVHLRTRKELSAVVAHWDAMPRIVALRDAIAPRTVLVGNGDVTSRADGVRRVREYGCDGVMVGRGVFGNPWFFNPEIAKEDLTIHECLEALLEHTRLFEELLPMKHFSILKKHYKAYMQGFPDSKNLRTDLLCNAKDADGVSERVRQYLARV